MGVTKKDNLSVVICLPDKQRVAEWLAFSRPGDRFSMLTKARWELCDTGPIGDPHALFGVAPDAGSQQDEGPICQCNRFSKRKSEIQWETSHF